MNERSNPVEDDVRFDLLVDGELSPQEYQELVASLDDLPGGWKRCATAFLEAQAWQSEFAPPVAAGAVDPVHRPREHRWRAARFLLPLAMAASFLTAFALGAAWRGWSSPGSTPDVQFADQPGQPGRELVRDDAVPNLGEHRLDHRHAPRDEPLGNLTLVVNSNDGNAPREVDVPVYNLSDSQELWSEPPQSERELMRYLERLGHQIRRQPQVVPVDLKDGRRVFVPVDEYQITPIRHELFQ